jgi:hypothetical protein
VIYQVGLLRALVRLIESHLTLLAFGAALGGGVVQPGQRSRFDTTINYGSDNTLAIIVAGTLTE